MRVEFFIPCEPTAKGRPRFTRNGHAYTPKTTRDAEKLIRKAVVQAMTVNGVEMIRDVPIAVRTDFLYSPLKSWGKRKLEMLERCEFFWKTTKPDVDNLKKLVLDAMNGLVYEDDALIAKSEETKRYCAGTAGVQITVWTLEEATE